MDPQGLHVINGSAAAGSWKAAFPEKSDRLLIQHDVLGCGPMPFCGDLETWKRVRAEYLATLIPASDHAGDSRFPLDLLDNLALLQDAENVYVWAATGLQDQLVLPFLSYLIEIEGIRQPSVALIQFERPPGGDRLLGGMGQLSPEQMAQPPEPVQLSEGDIDTCKRAWSALTSTSPDSLLDFLEFSSTIPRLSEAMQVLLRRYPRRSSGLGDWDWRLLQNVAARGPSVARVIGYTIGEDLYDRDCVGDYYLFRRLRNLGANTVPRPLVALGGDLSHMQKTTVVPTAMGEAVLSGTASSFPGNPIDDWIGGVHLSSATGNLWFFGNGSLHCVL